MTELSCSVPVELFLQQVQACVQLAALLATQAVHRGVEGWWGGQAAARNLLVLTTPPTLPPEVKDVGHTWEGTCRSWEGQCPLVGGRRHAGWSFHCSVPDRALQVLPVFGSASPSVFSLKFNAAWGCGFPSIALAGLRPVTTDSSPWRRRREVHPGHTMWFSFAHNS